MMRVCAIRVPCCRVYVSQYNTKTQRKEKKRKEKKEKKRKEKKRKEKKRKEKKRKEKKEKKRKKKEKENRGKMIVFFSLNKMPLFVPPRSLLLPKYLPPIRLFSSHQPENTKDSSLILNQLLTTNHSQ